MPVDVHNDLFLSASLIGEAMQSMVTTVSRKTGNEQVPIFSNSDFPIRELAEPAVW